MTQRSKETVRVRSRGKSASGRLRIDFRERTIGPDWQWMLSINPAGDVLESVGPRGDLFEGVEGLEGGVHAALVFDANDATPTEVAALAVVDDLMLELALASSAKEQPDHKLVVRRRDGQALRSADFERLGLGRVHDALRRLLSHEFAVQRLGKEWGAERIPRPGRRGRPDLFYAVQAQAYAQALAKDPKAPIKALRVTAPPGTTDGELRMRITRARERGLLTAGEPGKAGGELTPPAKKLLRDAGLYEGDE